MGLSDIYVGGELVYKTAHLCANAMNEGEIDRVYIMRSESEQHGIQGDD